MLYITFTSHSQYNSPTKEVPGKRCFELTFVSFVLKLIVLLSAITALALYMLYYTHCGILFEPIQACIDMHRNGQLTLGFKLAIHPMLQFTSNFCLSGSFMQGQTYLT